MNGGDEVSTGAFILQKRTELGLSQEELAERLRVSRPTISTWETDKFLPGTSYIKAMASLFHCTTDELLNPSPAPVKPGEKVKAARTA